MDSEVKASEKDAQIASGRASRVIMPCDDVAGILAKRFGMEPHAEGGSFIELNESCPDGNRGSSGAIYYYLAPGEMSDFHVLDCDEYWAFAAGGALDLWCVSSDGTLEVLGFGLEEGCEPLAIIRAGTIFAARHKAFASQGTFLSCITVPRFEYAGWRLVDRDEMLALCPDALGFYR